MYIIDAFWSIIPGNETTAYAALGELAARVEREEPDTWMYLLHTPNLDRGVNTFPMPGPEQVAFVRNTSDALSTVANGLSWRKGDNIVTFSREFPSNIYPWLRVRDNFGVEVRMCEERNGRIDFTELSTLIDQNTRIVAISHVQYASGFRMDLERLGRLARQHDALFVVDAIQALGVVPTDVEAEFIDVAAGAGHKWLLSRLML